MSKYFEFVLRHRLLVSITCLIITILAAVSMSRATLATSIPKLVLGESPEYLRYQDLITQFGNDEQLVVGWEQRDSASSRDRLRRVVARIGRLDEVQRVHSMLSSPMARMFGEGVLVSADGRHQAVAIELRADETRSIEGTPPLVRDITAIFVDEGFEAADLHLAGVPAMLAEIDTQSRHNIFRLTPAVAVLVLLMTWALLRRLWPVLMTLIVGAIAIIWTMGFAIALDREINIVLAAVPALILLVSFSDVVHLYNAYIVELRAGREREHALRTCATEVGRACLYTSATTFVGFLGISLINVPLFRPLGLILGFGVAVALLLAMTIVPIMLSLLAAPNVRLTASGGPLLDRFLNVVQRSVTSHPWAIIGAFAALLVGAGYGTSRIEIETDLIRRMSVDNPLRVDARYFDEHFSGTSTVDLYLTVTSEATDDSALLGRCIDSIERVDNVVRAIPVPGSLRLTETNARMHRVVVFVQPTGMYDIYRVGEAARRAAQTEAGDGATVEATGLLYLAGHWLDTHLVAQVTPLIVSLSIIALMMMLVARSWAIGLLSMAPNLVPLLMIGGLLGFAWNPTDSDALVTVLVAIGIAVDDTIHFIIRYRTERARNQPSSAAIGRTFNYAGRAIVITSLIFAVGFAPFAISDYLTLRMIGVLIPLAMLAALAGDLLLLPALLIVCDRKRR